ncbi:MAG: hypothetical protein VKJ06_02775 [Vampirovibrionales bacterium]|nr:hypothetical protein [Vampirovibrionales bacterium]
MPLPDGVNPASFLPFQKLTAIKSSGSSALRRLKRFKLKRGIPLLKKEPPKPSLTMIISPYGSKHSLKVAWAARLTVHALSPFIDFTAKVFSRNTRLWMPARSNTP